jgi:streptomycin 6-kinase
MIELHEEKGVAWLDRLPSIIAECERRWSLEVGPPFAALSYNYVAPAVRADGAEVVLKVGIPHPELMTEIEALGLYDGHGIVRLLDADREQGALLLERLKPGVPLSALEDDEMATSIMAQVMRELWRPAPVSHSFPTLPKWTAALHRLRPHFDGGSGPFPPALIAEAETLFAELMASAAEPVLLHGDLHHDNILTAERRPWLALDPKGVVGEPAFEVGAMLHNPLPQLLQRPNPGRVLARRVDQLAEELGIDRARIRAWGIVYAVLSAWWDYEDSGRLAEGTITCGVLLSQHKV